MTGSDPVAGSPARALLRFMGHGAAADVADTPEAYVHLFHGRFTEALVASRAAAPSSAYEAALAAQIEALCTGTIARGLPVPQGAPGTVEGAMEVFHLSEAAHIVGELEACVEMTRAALDAGVTDSDARVWVRLGLVRGLIFRGEVGHASAHLALASADARAPLARESVRCLEAMIAGLAGDDSAVVALAEELRATMDRPATYADAGIALLAAMGLALCHLPHAAAELLTHGAGGAGLPLLPPALRAYGYDVLIEAAVTAGNRALGAWIMLDFDRLDLGANRQLIAAREASRARLMETSERQQGAATGSPLLDARALLAAAPFDAAHHGETEALLDAVSTDELREWMERALATVGAVPRPLPEIGWDLLTPAQQTVARLAARGLSNDEIARLLVVSRRTVEGHMAAVLDILGLPNRIGLVRSAGTGAATEPPAALTQRQRDVAAALAEGLSNGEVAALLGVSVKAVEKHVHAIYRALGVTTRSAAVARLLSVD